MIKLRVKDILREKGITQKDLADRLNITEVGLSKSLSEKGNPTISTLDNIANALDVNITELFEPKGISGIIKIDNKSYEINSLDDIKKLLAEIEDNKS
ncbi:helix-turn-helix domain-containing protein [Dysgonomonas mossii]|uniref:HTH cro/C1-type domain-containing protein n=1 Tax=Dysgonomonas mossii DSM 22836 TaxID=742767 RepID=F8X4Z7_9BACT|nr:helix-turn-helix transcriptional regulator [Dysgonomonas mossii]EGK04695.1 hypothetical protein HMPREF9456_03306 [Dysgonomonas mossii DSM 22836]